MSANYITDLNATTQMGPSLSPTGSVNGLSGALIGAPIAMGNANGVCNLFTTGRSTNSSGPLILQVQCSDTNVSGNFTDPTSGLAQLPSVFASGGLVYIGSGGDGLWNSFLSGQSAVAVQSGFYAAAWFQRTGLYARVNMLTCQYVGNIDAGFISQLRTTGSGGGFSLQPSSGLVSV